MMISSRYTLVHHYIRNLLSVVAIVLVLVVLAQSQVSACPACKDGFSSNSTQAAIGETYSWTILFLLAVPATASGIIVWKIKKAMEEKEKKASMAQSNMAPNAPAGVPVVFESEQEQGGITGMTMEIIS